MERGGRERQTKSNCCTGKSAEEGRKEMRQRNETERERVREKRRI